jgi:2-polyprenyl-3-methyl-5-hydroxy-6-metoxy-1,4-benzoquinol methylase
MSLYGSEKWIFEESILRRWAYRFLGEVHVPGRLRSYHLLRALRSLGLFERPIRMLDAGSGRGDLALHLARRCPHWQIVGVDADELKIARSNELARRAGLENLQFETALLENLSYREEFDLIVSADVLEHIRDDERVIANFSRALRPRGYIVITSPSVPQRAHLPLVRWREKRIGFDPAQYGHVRQGYGPADLAEKFEAAGVRMIQSRFTFGFFGTLAFDLFFVIGDNRPHPVVFGLMFPALMALAAADLFLPTETGSAILAVAQRPALVGEERAA